MSEPTSNNFALYATLLSTGVGLATGVANYLWTSKKSNRPRRSTRICDALMGGTFTSLTTLGLCAFYKNPQQNCEQLPLSVVCGVAAYTMLTDDDSAK